MSILDAKTEKKALNTLAKTLKHFDKLATRLLSAEDAFQARQAESIVRTIIENNGYSPVESNRGTLLIKQKFKP